MEGQYDICCGDQIVGAAKVSREGLYYRFICRCSLDRKRIFKICIACGKEQILLGTPIPDGASFQLCARLPAKYFTGSALRFFIKEKGEEKFAEFVPVKADAPFMHLKDLENAVFCLQDGIPGVIIEK